MSKLRRLVVLLIFGLSTLVVIGNARSVEQGGSNVQGESVTASNRVEFSDKELSHSID